MNIERVGLIDVLKNGMAEIGAACGFNALKRDEPERKSSMVS